MTNVRSPHGDGVMRSDSIVTRRVSFEVALFSSARPWALLLNAFSVVPAVSFMARTSKRGSEGLDARFYTYVSGCDRSAKACTTNYPGYPRSLGDINLLDAFYDIQTGEVQRKNQ